MTKLTRSNRTSAGATAASVRSSRRSSYKMVAIRLSTTATPCWPAGAILQTKVNGCVSGSMKKPVFTLSLASLAELLVSLEPALRQFAYTENQWMDALRAMEMLPSTLLLAAQNLARSQALLTSSSPRLGSSNGLMRKATGRRSSTSKGGNGTRKRRATTSSTRSASKV